MPRRFPFRLFAALPSGDHVPDGELLRRFVATRDSAAFELLVRRHADAVWSAALRILGNDADAEDAFQATFLALARKATSIRDACAGAWLHRVAVNAALKRKASRERERPEEDALRSLTLPARQATADRDELAAIVHQELARLPDRYRLPVVLCDLEGQSHAQAAKALGWPVGSVSGRLSRARDILRDRLTRRGLTAPAVLVATAVAPSGATSAAVAVAVGRIAVSPAVDSLTKGVLSAMRIANLKLAAVVLAATGLVGLGTVGTFSNFARSAPQGEPSRNPSASTQKQPPKVTETQNGITAFADLDPKSQDDLAAKCPHIFAPEDVPILPNDDAIRQLQKARLNIALAELRLVTEQIKVGRSESLAIVEACNRAVSAATDVFTDRKELRPWLEERVRIAKWNEKMVAMRVAAGADPSIASKRAQFARLDAEIALLKLDQPAAGR